MPKVFPTMEVFGGINLESAMETIHAWMAYAKSSKHAALFSRTVCFKLSIPEQRIMRDAATS